MIKKLKSGFAKVQIKWKLAIWATVLLLILFAAYNIFQYLVIENWASNYEEQALKKRVNEIQAYFHDKDNPDFSIPEDSENFLYKMNEEYQMMRITDTQGKEVFLIQNELPAEWIPTEQTEKVSLHSMFHHEDHIIVVRAPINTINFQGTIEIARNMESFDGLIDQILIVMIAAFIGAIILSFLGGTIISKQLLNPLASMTETMKKIKQDNLNERVPVPAANDEISQLGTIFNEMMDDLEESFMKQKQFVEDASHELRTPLSIVHGHLSLLNRWGKDDQEVLNKSLKSSLNEVNRLIHLVSELLEITRAEGEKKPLADFDEVDVVKVVSNGAKNFSIIHPEYEINLQLNESEKLMSKISANHLEQVLVILLDNAVKYSVDKQVIDLSVCRKNKQVFVEVKDYGMGIPAADLPYIFDRFYRVDKARSRKKGGSGLGLSIAKRIIENADGQLEVESVENKGTSMKIRLPLV